MYKILNMVTNIQRIINMPKIKKIVQILWKKIKNESKKGRISI